MSEFGSHPESGFFRRLADFTRGPEGRPSRFATRLRKRLVVGFLVAFPLVVTVFFALFLFDLLDRWFRPVARHYFGFPIPGIGAALSLLGLYLLGLLATNVLGGRILSFFERRIARIPLLSPIYQGARQVTEALQARETYQFRKVVLVRFPHNDVRSLGFVTREIDRPSRFADEASLLVFVPTTPNPTSGFLISVRKRDVTELNIPVEAGVKLVISGGLVVPDQLLSPLPPATDNPTQG
ncbi:MAG: DUF502 domain-containing protein [Acidobacteria bacterium]|jgi:uncharacterized membrane protein|nr:DUF502 domain-containing protein [Acidobacteriota bacterium]